MNLPPQLTGELAQPEHAALAYRDLQRGTSLGLPAGEAVAAAIGVTPLCREELALPDDLCRHGTPLVYYIQREAMVQHQGEYLGAVGGRMLAEVLLGLLLADPTSYLHAEPDWRPTLPSADGPFRLLCQTDGIGLAAARRRGDHSRGPSRTSAIRRAYIQQGATMAHYSYLIIGGGMTAAAAVQGIREIDSNNPIGLIGAEAQPSYKRPPLSKALWKGEPFAQVWIDIELQGVELFLGRQAQSLDAAGKQVTDDQGTVYTFDKLLLATGGTPKRFSWDGDQIIYYRTLADYRWLRSLTAQGQRFAVIGGGFIGSEIAAALAMNKKDVVMLFPETKISERIFGPDLSQFLNDYYEQNQVELLAGERAIGVERRGAQLVLTTQQGRALLVDGVIAGIGIEPNTELAQAAGLKVDNGIVVDELLRTTHPDIYAAGDVANFYHPALGKRLRVEHKDNATTMGMHVGRAMAGQATPYTHLPFFYSDLFDLGYEAVGELDARLEIVADWKDPFREGVLYYLHDQRVQGVLLWNVWGQVDAARRLIAAPGPFQPGDLIGRLPES